MDTAYLPTLIFFAIALVFSMLGMGGSQLYIPILFWTGTDFKTEAIPVGMSLNVVSSSSAAITIVCRGLVPRRLAIPFAAAIVVLGPVSVWLNVRLPAKPLLVFFALFTASAAVLMLSGWKPQRSEMSSRGRVALGLTAGGGLGLVAGLIGRGGGSFIVPLWYVVGLEARVVAATSAPIVTRSGLSSFVPHLATAARS